MKQHLLFLLVLSPTLVTAQRPVALRENLCEQCAVRLTPVVDLPGIDSLGGITSTFHLARDSRGRYYHTNYLQPSVIQVFDSTGKVLTTIGKKGTGPGEFNHANFIAVGLGDTLHVFDSGNRRYTVLSPDYKVVRTGVIGAQVMAAAELRPSRLILAASVRSKQGIPQPLHFWTQNALQPGFGADAALKSRPAHDDRILWRTIAVSADGSFWTARRQEYMLEQWSANRTLLRQLVRRVEWFEPYAIDDSFIGGAPRPFVLAINEDSTGRLWVLISVANPNWKQAMGRGPAINGRQTARVASPDPTAVRWTRIEVIDTRKAEVVASSLIKQAFDGFSPGGNVFSPVVDKDGVAIMRVWRVDTN
jgi:hypothetical protein